MTKPSGPFPAGRTGVMSELPSPGRKRLPFGEARAVDQSRDGVRDLGGSAKQSATSMTLTPPVQAAKPQARALSLPFRGG
jgi:hypothetical protein